MIMGRDYLDQHPPIEDLLAIERESWDAMCPLDEETLRAIEADSWVAENGPDHPPPTIGP